MAIPSNNNTDDKEKQDKLKALADALGLGNFQSEIDTLKAKTDQTNNNIRELMTSWNEFNAKLAQSQQPQSGSTTTTPVNPFGTSQVAQLEKLQQAAPLFDGLAKMISAWKGTGAAGEGQVDLVNTIMGAFSKLIQIQIDNAVLNTYPQAREFVKPPSWIGQSNITHAPG
jgi:hypothetical protein